MIIVSFVYITLLTFNLTILSLRLYRGKLTVQFKILAVVLTLALLLELCTSVWFEYLDNNLFFYHLYNPVEFSLYSFFFVTLNMSKTINRIIYVMIAVLVSFALISTLAIQTIDVNNSYVVISESILLIVYCLLYLRHINIYEIDRRAEKNPYFWMTIGILLNFTANLFIEGSLHLLLNIGEDLARMYYRTGFVFKYFMCIFFLVSLAVARQPGK